MNLLKRYGLYLLPILLIFVVASVEFDLLTAFYLILKLAAFSLSLMFPIIVSAKLSTFNLKNSSKLNKLLRIDRGAFIFVSIQVVLWFVDLHQLQLYIVGIAIALFIITLLIFLIIRYLG